ncbi:MAG: methylthioribose-1-phosphate isomerase, partial [Bacteroidetes bacterium]|nr:methylthioribose-1-phosphate isomerase [Bacteroidota bacterium]
MTSVEWVAGKVRFIDQTRLPSEEVIVETSDYTVVADAIKKLKIRGAPAIGVAAAFALLLAVDDKKIFTPKNLEEELHNAINVLSQTRPTAVNLFAALDRMRRVYQSLRHDAVGTIRLQLNREAHCIQQEDIEACRKIGEHGAALIGPGSTILTHCNTGALATAGEG